MESTKSSNGHVSPVLAAVLDCFQSPPTRAYRDPHPSHPGQDKLAADLLDGKDIAATPSPTAPTILTPRYAPQPGDADVRPDRFDGVPQDVYGVGIPVKTSSPGEDAGNQGRTAAPTLDWRSRCHIEKRDGHGVDAVSPGGLYELNVDGQVWQAIAPGSTFGMHLDADCAKRALAVAPMPPDWNATVYTQFVRRPKDAGAIAQQEKSTRWAREAGRTEAAADKAHGVDREAEARAHKASVVKAQRNAYERGARDLTEYLRTAMRDARTIADAERWVRNLAPWCPSCGEPMTREAATPADPSVGIARPTPAHWVCCGVGIKDGDGPIAPEDNKIPASAVVAA